jgi:hypothetical protein
MDRLFSDVWEQREFFQNNEIYQNEENEDELDLPDLELSSDIRR